MVWKHAVLVPAILSLAACISYKDPSDLHAEQTMELCESYASSGPQAPFGHYDSEERRAIRDELVRREAVSENDWALVDEHKARVGMKECALVASWGSPQKISHTDTQRGSSEQYSFGKCPWSMCTSNQYAYIAKGKVIGLQY